MTITRKHASFAITLVCILIAAASCNNSNNNRSNSRNNATMKTRTPPFVAFCNSINYADTAALHNEQAMKKTVAKLVKLLFAADSVTARTGLTIFFNGLRHDETALTLATGAADQYLNHPTSPARNEGKYINFLSVLLDVDSLPDLARDVATKRLRIASLNRPGTFANNFHFEKPDGLHSSLYDITAPATLVIFYNPECGPCSKILTNIAVNPAVNAAIRKRKLSVVAIYAEGNRDVWRNSLKKLPGYWTIGYDLSDILAGGIYDLPAMPTLYLLDANKRVLLKDPDHRILGKYLRRMLMASM